MAKKIDPNKMTPQELEQYVNSLPDKQPPKWSSVGWLIVFGIVAIILGIAQVSNGTANITAWSTLIGGVAALGGAGYLIYKILTFNQNP